MGRPSLAGVGTGGATLKAMAWLVRDGEVLAALEVAADRRARRRGLLGRDRLDGALLLRPTRAVHTLGMRFPIDVAFCAETPGVDGADGSGGADEGAPTVPLVPPVLTVLTVLKTCTMPRHRVGLPCLRAGAVLEAEAGAFARWGLQPGDVLEVR